MTVMQSYNTNEYAPISKEQSVPLLMHGSTVQHIKMPNAP